MADLLKCSHKEIYFTSGATLGNNIVLRGVLKPFVVDKKPAHLITTAIEHKSVQSIAEYLERHNVEVTCLAVDKHGLISPDALKEAIKPHTKLVSLIWANNEIGTLQPITECAQIARNANVLFHTDATQVIGKIPLALNDSPIDFLTLSAHKIYGPKGTGAFYMRSGLTLDPILFGGSQESSLSPGTYNTPGIVGLGEACHILKNEGQQEYKRILSYQRRLLQFVDDNPQHIKLNGHPKKRICNNINLSFTNLNQELFSMNIHKKIAVSSIAACSSDSPQKSHVLSAIGLDSKLQSKTMRIGLGRMTTSEEVDQLLEVLNNLVKRSPAP